MEKYLITGVGGFVAKHFLDLLRRTEEPCQILGLDFQRPTDPSLGNNLDLEIEQCNLLEADRLSTLIRRFRPTRLLHLASVSSVGVSWKSPVESFLNNTNIFLNIIDTIRLEKMTTRVLSVGSSEEYGNFKKESLPLREEHALNPSSPYGVARVAQEQLSKVYVDGYGLDIVLTRSFNHIGPGQRDQFVIASFVKQVVLAKFQRVAHCHITAGNINVIRDFVDVRDVVEAYSLLFSKGRSGEIYNVCSGIGVSLSSILDELAQIVGFPIHVETDPTLLRPNELPVVIGVPEKLRIETGWKPRLTLNETLRDLVEYWTKQLQDVRGTMG